MTGEQRHKEKVGIYTTGKAGHYVKDIEFKILPDNNLTPGTSLEKDGVHFGYYAREKAVPVLLLYRKGTEEPVAEIPFPGQSVPGAPYVMKIRMRAAQYEYNFLDGSEVVTDPYAKKIVGREVFGVPAPESAHSVRGGFITKVYDWQEDKLPQIPFDEAVMYHLHVRGFTMQKNSGARKKGTFAGLQEKIPYLKSLGINQVRLMPVYEFTEMMQLHAQKKLPAKTQQEAKARAFEHKQQEKRYKMNFWGYGEGYYFAPKASFAATRNPDEELRNLVKAFHAEGIEVLLEFSFPDDMSPAMIGDCLNYWAFEYHIDGFAVIGRDTLKTELSKLPLFRSRKLICGWYPEDVVRENAENGYSLIASSNDGFMVDCRRLLKGEENALSGFGFRIRQNPDGCAQINYITNHDGFTLLDLVSYDEKHNEDNEEMGRDGSEYNFSWNCGTEGPTKRRDILKLRMRQRKNAYAMMLFSQGVPMLLAGDEFGNSQNGNNNPYCHDSELSWTDWSHCKANGELTDFVRKAIAFRKKHAVLHQKKEPKCMDYLSNGYPDLSFHSDKAWYGEFIPVRRHLGCMYCGHYAGEEGYLYIAWNFHWDEQQFALPFLPKNSAWYKVMDTSLKESFPDENGQECLKDVKSFTVPPRTVVILEGRE